MRFFKDMKFWKKVTLICGIPLLLISMLIGAMSPIPAPRIPPAAAVS